MKRLAALLLAGLSTLCEAGPAAPEGILVLDPSPAPALSVSDAEGERYELSETPGRWVFVHFWASWCGPCRKEMPAIERMRAAVDGWPLDVVLVNTAEDEDRLFFFLAEVAPQLHSYRDPDGLVTEAWQPRGLPATYLVDAEGRLRYQALGGRPWDEPAYLEFLERLVSPPVTNGLTSVPARP
jgi:thiol-disulfide isomerase/thioredoxin